MMTNAACQRGRNRQLITKSPCHITSENATDSPHHTHCIRRKSSVGRSHISTATPNKVIGNKGNICFRTTGSSIRT